jgi:hypothetical protein
MNKDIFERMNQIYESFKLAGEDADKVMKCYQQLLIFYEGN